MAVVQRSKVVVSHASSFAWNEATAPASGGGGGLFIDGAASVTLEAGVALTGNRAEVSGGALFLAAVNATTVADVTAARNRCGKAPARWLGRACSRSCF